jgi:hypothetical protein
MCPWPFVCAKSRKTKSAVSSIQVAGIQAHLAILDFVSFGLQETDERPLQLRNVKFYEKSFLLLILVALGLRRIDVCESGSVWPGQRTLFKSNLSIQQGRAMRHLVVL